MIELLGLAVALNHIEVVEVYAGKNLLQEEIFTDSAIETLSPSIFSSSNTNIAEQLERFSGLNKVGQGGLFQSYSIRGLGGWRIRTHIDGIPIITDRRAGNSASFLPPSLVQMYEVKKGASSMMHGSGAIGGVMNLTTKKPEHPTFSATRQAPNQGTSFSIGSGNISNSFLVSYRRADNQESASGVPLNTGYKQFAALLYQQGSFSGGLEYNLSWLPAVGKDIGKSSAKYPSSQIAIYPKDNHSLFQATLNSDSWFLKVFHHYQNWDSQVERIGSRENLTSYQSHTYGSNIYSSIHTQTASWRYGVDWLAREGIKISDRETPISSAPQNQVLIDGSTLNIAPFVDTAIQLDNVKVNIGARYDYFEAMNEARDRSDNHLSYQSSVEQKFKNHFLRVSYGSAFRFPAMTELYFNGVTPRGDTFGNQFLKPEKSRTVELNYIYSHPSFSGRLNVYKSTLDNFIERTKLENDDRTYINLNRVNIGGYEFALETKPTSQQSLKWNIAKQHAQQHNGNYVQGVAPLKMSVTYQFNLREIELSTEVTHRFKKHRVSSSEQPLPSSTLVNAYAKWQLTDTLSSTLRVSNALNSEFRTTADEDAPFVSQRQISLQLDWRN
ncbi:TonB-dependent receptor [Pseudoalteromonas luteoviolacea]|uniref:TonB-dependent receptor n=1 Tax=Pseudoalteromonas luteoviolacea NCIMB 1942 TaxID=1365253 RepID=A0A167HQQ9_9GAMM|nr:TonB-dependent receptor [Pseudoalteromonas luteoviolacea]KZN58400.1 hypothetical protein N482_22390 [Pseudoalteromonas luteoviolacea NCIMB 1942]